MSDVGKNFDISLRTIAFQNYHSRKKMKCAQWQRAIYDPPPKKKTKKTKTNPPTTYIHFIDTS